MNNSIVQALAPAFAAGFALQQLLEILDPLFSSIVKTPTSKKVLLGFVSLGIGLLFAWLADLRVLNSLIDCEKDHWLIDRVVTGLIISGGTEGFNSIMKFLGYKKEEKKGEAARAQRGDGEGIANLNR